MAWNILHGGNDIENGQQNSSTLLPLAPPKKNPENIWGFILAVWTVPKPMYFFILVPSLSISYEYF